MPRIVANDASVHGLHSMHRIGLRSKRRHKPMPLEQGYDVGGFEAASCSESLFVARQWLPVTDRHTSTIAGSRSLIWLQRRDAGGDVFSEPCVSQIVRSARKVVASWSMNRGVDARTSI